MRVCPDGSEPVKSISADGTYFVYNCGGSAESSTETSSTNPNGLLPDALKQIKVVKDWEPIADWESVKEYAKASSNTQNGKIKNGIV